MVNTCKIDSNTNPIFKPSMIAGYNRNMGGIDIVDQQLHGLHLLRKSYKWYKKLALRLLSQVAQNSHKIYCKVIGSKTVFLDYLQDVVTSLITIEEPISGEIKCNDDVSRLVGRYFPSLKIATPGAKCQRSVKPCRMRYAKGKRTDKGHKIKTTYVCVFCPSEPGLHPDKSFGKYHTKMDYSK